ncbi:GL24058 [Drosophila persimilis]|uniref:GL24058 n=1 Tax=Drosophila persimilis TaxID=7234 RepID=B4G399_DROPE|nr:keratin, type II cytoskeletal 2 oral [Drosophila persimilis]XP_017140367.1 keratin, type II cytoskeletal 2 oral [Drosophila miranda]EDW24281.1 GL24058 [Drosophila persimilis]
MKFFIATACVLLLAAGISADPVKAATEEQSGAFAKCLDTDSISCLQLTLFRKAKSIFDNPQIELFGGVSLVKANEGRQGKSLDNSVAVEAAPTVEARTAEMGNYFMDNAKSFFAERSLNFNFANAARSVARAIPDDIKADLRELVVESRTRKKKLLKKFLPILLGVGAKIAVLGVGSIFGLLFLAKKALVVSVIAFFLALAAGASSGLGRIGGSGGSGGLLGGLGGLFGGKNAGSSSSASSGGWSSGGGAPASNGWSSGGSSGWDTHGAYSSPVAQTIAYQGYKQARR